jgi:hypothetical protein
VDGEVKAAVAEAFDGLIPKTLTGINEYSELLPNIGRPVSTWTNHIMQGGIHRN